jgi:hypothetical protein
MKSGNQHEHEATESKKYDTGVKAPCSMNIEKEPGDKDLQQQAHSQKTNRL